MSAGSEGRAGRLRRRTRTRAVASGQASGSGRAADPADAGPAQGAGPGPGAGPVDPDVDLHTPAQRAETAGGARWRVPAVVAAGGALGAAARYGATLAWPAGEDLFPWPVLVVNVTGCALIGVLMVLVAEAGSAHPLVRPFLGTGVLGGFTTFSAYAADVARLLAEGEQATALAYAAGTPAAALGAVFAAATATRAAVAGRAAVR